MRFLATNRTTRHPSLMVALDTETRRGKFSGGSDTDLLRFRLGHAISWRWERGKVTRREAYDFTRVRDWWEWLRSKLDRRRTCWVWAHKAVFDFTVLRGWEMLGSGALTYKAMADADPPWYVAGELDGCKVVFLDLMNWHRCSLEKLGESLGLAKLPMPSMAAPIADWQTYCRRDTEIVEKAVQELVRFLTENDLGVMRFTAAGQSLQAYRHRFAPRFKQSDVYKPKHRRKEGQGGEACYPIPHGNDWITQLERRSHVGGQPECYQLGEVDGPVHVLDATGFYPSLLRDNLYPSRYLGYRRNVTPAHALNLARKYATVATALVVTHEETYPKKLKDMTVQARGEFWACLAGPELVQALERDRVGLVSELAYYERMPLFGKFVDALWDLRKLYLGQGRGPQEQLVKLLSNGLHGKFSQRRAGWENDPKAMVLREWGRWSVIDGETGRLQWFRGIAGNAQKQTGEDELETSFPLIASYVCSYGRLRMAEWVKIARPENVFYTAVDCLHVNEAGRRRLQRAGLVANHQLGKLRLQATHSWVHYYGLGVYRTPAGPVAGGLSRRAVEVRPGVYKQVAMQSAKDVIADRPFPGILAWEEEYKLDRLFRHGMTQPNGRVIPFTLNDKDAPDYRDGDELPGSAPGTSVKGT